MSTESSKPPAVRMQETLDALRATVATRDQYQQLQASQQRTSAQKLEMTLTTRHSTLETKLTGLQGALQEAMTQLYTQQRTVTVWLAVLTVACIALALVVVLVR